MTGSSSITVSGSPSSAEAIPRRWAHAQREGTAARSATPSRPTMPSTSSTCRLEIPVVAGPQVVAGRPLRVDGLGLEEACELGERGVVFRERAAVDGGAALARAVEAEDHAHRGRPPGAVRPEEAGDDTGADGKAQVVDRDRLAVALGEGGDFDHAATMNDRAARRILPP